MIPGNFLQENWWMGAAKTEINSLQDFKERVIDELSGDFKLRYRDGRKITIRMGSKGILIIEPVDINEEQ